MSDRTIIEGDAFDLLADLEPDSAHAAVLDYPWEFEIQNGTGRFEYRGTEAASPQSGYREQGHDDEMYDMAADERFGEVVAHLADALVDGAWLICMADDRFQDVVRATLQADDDWIFRRNWAWTPQRMGMGYYGRVDHYPMPVATNGETDRHVTGRGTLISVPNGRDTEYSTGKPVALYRQALESPVIERGERLLEPFCGSAPGAAVAVERDLGYWACDIEADALELARDRLATTTFNNYQATVGEVDDGDE